MYSDEASFWLEFIVDEKLVKSDRVEPLPSESKELTAIFYASRKTARKG
jgi:hypothetical protein